MSRILSYSIAAFVLSLAGAVACAQVPGKPIASYSAVLGPYAVEAPEPVAIRDETRSRDVLTQIYAPIGPGPFPVIVFSHGFGGSYRQFANTARFWASYGYLVLTPTHADSILYGDLDERDVQVARAYLQGVRSGALESGARAAFLDLLERPAHIENRAGDLALIVRALGEPGSIEESVRARADLARLGLAGHSYGAYTALVVAGATLERDGRAISFANPAFSAFLAVSAQGPGRMSLTPGSFDSVAAPTMNVTATRDRGADGESPDWRLSSFWRGPPEGKYALMLEGLGHGDFDGELGDASDPLKALSLAFWDAHLRGVEPAQAYLIARASEPQSGALLLRRAGELR